MKLTLVRHGETPANVDGVLDTAVPGPKLTARGLEQAEALVDRFADDSFDSIWASTHIRTQITAQPIAADRGIDVQVRHQLREFSVGDLEGRSDPAAMEVFLGVWKDWILGDLASSMPGGETGHQVLQRMDEAIGEISSSEDQSALVFSHGGVLRIWAGARSSNISTEFTLANYLVNTGVIVVTGSPAQGWYCESWDRAPGARH